MSDGVMVGFGGKQAWLAVAGDDPAALIEALGLRDLGPVPWREGIDLAYLTDDRVAVSPPLPGARDIGWIRATGRLFLHRNVDVLGLSEALGTEVQYVATHRVTELH